MTGIIAAAGITAAAGLAGGLLGKSGGGGGQPLQYQQTNSQYPDWVNNMAMQNYGDATSASYNLMPPYSGQRVADMTSGMTSDIAALQGNVGSTTPWFNQALNQTNALAGFNPSMVTPQTLAGTNLSPYENPYTQSVIDPSMQLLNQQNQQGLNQIGANAIGAKAFGGSRQGVAEGAQNAQTNLLAGQLGANLWGQNFNQAQAAATGDITRNMQGQVYNQSAGLQGAQLRGQMAQQLGTLANQGQQGYITGLQAAMGGQQIQQQQQQAQLDAARQYYAEQQQFPLQQLQIRQNALAQSPYGQQSIQQSPGPSSSPLLTGFGTAATTAGLIGSLGKAGVSWPSWLGGGSGIPTPASQDIGIGSIGGQPQSYYT